MKNVKKMAIIAISIALFVVLDRYCSFTLDNLKITFNILPVLILAFIYGPIEALIAGLLGSFVGQMLSYGFSVTTVLWIIPAGFRGLVVGLFSKKGDIIDNKIKLFLVLILSGLAVTVINTLVMYIDSKIFHYFSYAYLFGSILYRIIASIITSIIYFLILPIIIKPLKVIAKK